MAYERKQKLFDQEMDLGDDELPVAMGLNPLSAANPWAVEDAMIALIDERPRLESEALDNWIEAYEAKRRQREEQDALEKSRNELRRSPAPTPAFASQETIGSRRAVILDCRDIEHDCSDQAGWKSRRVGAQFLRHRPNAPVSPRQARWSPRRHWGF